MLLVFRTDDVLVLEEKVYFAGIFLGFLMSFFSVVDFQLSKRPDVPLYKKIRSSESLLLHFLCVSTNLFILCPP